MATIVRDITNDTKYVLLGSGFGVFQSKKPNWFLGNLMADTEEGQYALICVSDSQGEIGWMESRNAEVISVG